MVEGRVDVGDEEPSVVVNGIDVFVSDKQSGGGAAHQGIYFGHFLPGAVQVNLVIVVHPQVFHFAIHSCHGDGVARNVELM